MTERRGFTLLELLLAIVLLAVVTTVCVPYLRPSQSPPDIDAYSTFVLSVDEKLATLARSQSGPITIEQMTSLADTQGWRYEAPTQRDPDQLGIWVTISDDRFQVCRWALVPLPDEESP